MDLRRGSGVGAGALLALSVMTGCGAGAGEFEARPSVRSFAHEVDSAADPGALMDLADVVVVGHVVAVRQGRDRGVSQGDKMTDRIVRVAVDRVIEQDSSNAAIDEGAAIDVLEGYWDEDREGVAINDVDWSAKGDQGVYFLHRMEGEQIFRLATSYGRLLYPRSVSADTAPGPSGQAPYDSVWEGTRQELSDLDEAVDYVTELAEAP